MFATRSVPLGSRRVRLWLGGPVLAGLLAAAAASWALFAVAAQASSPCSTASGVTTCTYSSTGAEQQVTIPAGVSSFSVDAIGAAGSTDGYGTNSPGGLGAEVTATLPVSGAETLYIEVGGTGAAAPAAQCTGGGWNGGGAGCSYGGSGGGASDVRTIAAASSGSLDSRLVVAAGGGGASYDSAGGSGDQGTNPGDGGSGSGSGCGGGGGGGGTASGGGAGGGAGSDGGFGIGAEGSDTGSGGGGGYWGGGSGGCAGGAGSSFVSSTATASAFLAPTSAAPMVTISWLMPTTAITLDPTTPSGSNGWYTGSVGVSVSGTESGGAGVAETVCELDPSGVPTSYAQILAATGAPCSLTSVSANGSHVVYAASIDNAGNTSAVTSASFEIDASAPSFSLQLLPSAPSGSNGWYTGGVFVGYNTNSNGPSALSGAFDCVVDPASVPTSFADIASDPGEVSCTSLGTIDSDGSYMVYGASVSGAGVSSNVASVSFEIDVTPPSTSLSLSPSTPNGTNGWYTSSVGVGFSSSDNAGGSGVAQTLCVLDPASVPTSYANIAADAGEEPCSSLTSVNSNGAHVIYAASIDNAGNASMVTSVSFKIGEDVPTFSLELVPSAPTGSNGWYTSGVSFGWTAADTGPPGIASGGMCVVNPASVPTSFADIVSDPGGTLCGSLGTIATNGSYTVYGATVSEAGVTSNVASVSFGIDSTAPALTASATAGGKPYAAGTWTNQNVTVHFICTDSISGVNTATVTPDTTISRQGANQEVAGSCTNNAGIKSTYTFTPIDIDKTPPTITFAGNVSYTILQTVDLTCHATDALSGIATTNCTSPLANAPAWSFGPGNHTVNATATDNAGNTTNSSTTFKVTANPSSLCTLTKQFVDGSSSYMHGTAVKRAGANLLTTVGCVELDLAGPPGLLELYQACVGVMEREGFLTIAQQQTLDSFARTLT